MCFYETLALALCAFSSCPLHRAPCAPSPRCSLIIRSALGQTWHAVSLSPTFSFFVSLSIALLLFIPAHLLYSIGINMHYLYLTICLGMGNKIQFYFQSHVLIKKKRVGTLYIRYSHVHSPRLTEHRLKQGRT